MYTKETRDHQFFVAFEDGVCGMNQKAIAALSGMSEDSFRRLVKKSIANRSENPHLLLLYGCQESSYLLDVSYFNHKVWKSEYAYNIICYAATELKNDAAIETLTRLGQIGLRAFIQDLTGFQLTKGSDADLVALHNILGMKDEMARRKDHKIANMEYFRDNISNIWKYLFEIRGSVSYYRDLAILPPQVQKNVFRAIHLLKDCFWSIQRLRNDFEVESLDQLSKDRIEMVSKTLPKVLNSRKLTGEGLTVKQWQWDDLFSIDFDTVYDETKKGEDKLGFSTFGRRKDLTALAVQNAKENCCVAEEEILSDAVKRLIKEFEINPQVVSEIFDVAYANYVSKESLIERVTSSLPEIAEKFTKVYKNCDESRGLMVELKSYIDRLYHEDIPAPIEDRLPLLIMDLEFIFDLMERAFGSLRYNGCQAYEDSTHKYVIEEHLHLKQFEKKHFYYIPLYNCIYNLEHEILPSFERDYGLPWRHTYKMVLAGKYKRQGLLDGQTRFDAVIEPLYLSEDPYHHGLTDEDYALPIITK